MNDLSSTPDTLSQETEPSRLIREAVCLGLILGASLVTVTIEQRLWAPWTGYPSTLLLLGLTWLYQRRFGVRLRLRPAGRLGRWCVGVLAGVLVVQLFFKAALATLAPFAGGEAVPAAQLVHLVLLVPIAEEIYFRGLLLEHLRRGIGTVPAILACSLLFALLHLPTGGALSAFWLSIGTCALVVWTGALAPALQLHIAWNALSQISQLEEYSSTNWSVMWGASALVVLLAIVGRRKAVATGETIQ
ncbi:MAG: CPBP family intramembrane metalloprotease [Pirellulales bacterium]|nr:CPBP family intramembrane metalloprotease [Pirellulales bacterium]